MWPSAVHDTQQAAAEEQASGTRSEEKDGGRACTPIASAVAPPAEAQDGRTHVVRPLADTAPMQAWAAEQAALEGLLQGSGGWHALLHHAAAMAGAEQHYWTGRALLASGTHGGPRAGRRQLVRALACGLPSALAHAARQLLR